MNLHVARGAVLVPRLFKVMEVGSVRRRGLVRVGMTLDTELGDSGSSEQPRIRGTVRIVAGRAALDLRRRMLEHKWSLFVRVTFHARLFGARDKPHLLRFESAVLIVTIRALHGAFEYTVMEGLQELRFGLAMTGYTELRLGLHEHLLRRLIGCKARDVAG